MSTLLNAMQTGDTYTENGRLTNSTTLNPLVDLFFTIGAVRKSMTDGSGDTRIIQKFEAAYNSNQTLTKKMLFWARDVRGGAGERAVFRALLKHLAVFHTDDVLKNLNLVTEYGRWDDVFILFGTPVEKQALQLIKDALYSDNAGLVAKWLPRLGGKVNKEKKEVAHKVRNFLKLTPSEYRKLLVSKTNVVETPMCAKQFDTIEYNAVPSVALSRYTKAFTKRDVERFSQFINKVKTGEAKINTAAVYPYNVVQTLKQGNNYELANEMWKNLPNYFGNTTEHILPLCDVSPSMDTSVSGSITALDVCISLGLYISERNTGIFKDSFVTFSEKPTVEVLSGDLRSRYTQLKRANWGGSTNLDAAFTLLLSSALKANVPANEMPTQLLIISDMEFNSCVTSNTTQYQGITEKYKNAGYELPKVVFWNIASRHDNFPVQAKTPNTALVSGFSPSILTSLLSGEDFSPTGIMLKTLNNERYSAVV